MLLDNHPNKCTSWLSHTCDLWWNRCASGNWLPVPEHCGTVFPGCREHNVAKFRKLGGKARLTEIVYILQKLKLHPHDSLLLFNCWQSNKSIGIFSGHICKNNKNWHYPSFFQNVHKIFLSEIWRWFQVASFPVINCSGASWLCLSFLIQRLAS